jgi:ribosomal protein S18 acetylase RimI-like enzyme
MNLLSKIEASWQQSIAERTAEVWVAELPDGISGWIAFGASRDEDATADVGEIEAIYIDPRHWRRGIGKALWLKAQKRLIARNFSSTTLWVLAGNLSAIEFYETQGFAQSRTPVRVSERDDKELVEVRYEVPLTKYTRAIADTAFVTRVT